MFPLALAFASAMTWGTADFVGGSLARRHPLATVMLISQATGLVFTIVLVLVSGDPVPSGDQLLAGVAAGLAGTVGLAALYRGLAIGPMGIVAPTASLSVAVPVLSGLVSGERPTTLQFAGMALAILGIVLAARPRADPGTSDRPPLVGRGIVFALVAAVFIGILLVGLDRAAESSAVWAVFVVRMTSVPLFLVVFLMTTERRAPERREAATMAGVGLADNTANVLFAVASARGLLSLVTVIGSLYPVTTVLLARTFQHERLARHQVAGVALAFAGVAAIAAG
jgi:drug/metabolite transporter (DMT)-like permease